MKILRSLAMGALGLGLAAAPSQAVVFDSTNMTVSVTIQTACTITSVDNADFGTIAPGTALPIINMNITANCALGQAYNWTADAGQNLSGTIRRMADAGGTNFVQYSLFDPDTSAQWGDTGFAATTAGVPIPEVGSGADFTDTVRADGGPGGSTSVPDGLYTDTLLVQIEL